MKLITISFRVWSLLAWFFTALSVGVSAPSALAASQSFNVGAVLEQRVGGGYDSPTSYWSALKSQVNASTLSATAKTNAINLINSVSFSSPLMVPNPKTWTGTDCSLSIWTERYPDYIVSAGHIAGSAWSADISLDVTDTPAAPPPQVKIKATPVSPSAGISANPSSVTLGSSSTLSLSSSSASTSSLSGPGVSMSDPGSSVSVTPSSVGSSSYTYTVKGYVSLNWTSDSTDGDFTLTGSNGFSATVGANSSTPVYADGVTYTNTQTNAAGSAFDSTSVSIPTTSASTTVTAVSPPPVINSFSGNRASSGSSPSVSISASPSSGTISLNTTVSWSVSNASSFNVTKDGSGWASSGSSQSDSLSVGSYTYTITAQPVSFSGSLSWNVSNASSVSVSGPGSVSISGSSATVSAPGSYTITATNAGGSVSHTTTVPSGPGASSSSVSVSVGKGKQSVALSPGLVLAAPGEVVSFSASGSQTGYVWGGSVAGGGALKSLSAPTGLGDYVVTVQAPADAQYEASAPVQAILRVQASMRAELVPLVSNFTVQNAASPLNGRVYKRLWQDGGAWAGYLGREGLRFSVSGSSSRAVSWVELQGQDSSAGAAWLVLASGAPDSSVQTGGVVTVAAQYALRLGEVSAASALVPLSYERGAPLVGTWKFRARLQDETGRWSDWSAEVPVRVELPLVAKSEQVQTLPPAGEAGAWFRASEVKRFDFLVWIP